CARGYYGSSIMDYW
nr:immunoglobulin heavy chain junction region [Mus musculus]